MVNERKVGVVLIFRKLQFLTDINDGWGWLLRSCGLNF